MTRKSLDKGKQHVKDMAQRREQNDEVNDTVLLPAMKAANRGNNKKDSYTQIQKKKRIAPPHLRSSATGNPPVGRFTAQD
jgi:hypothetical protein